MRWRRKRRKGYSRRLYYELRCPTRSRFNFEIRYESRDGLFLSDDAYANGVANRQLFILNTTRIYYVRLVGLTSTGVLAGLRGAYLEPRRGLLKILNFKLC